MDPIVIKDEPDAPRPLEARVRLLEAGARAARAERASVRAELAELRASLEGVVQLLEVALAPSPKRPRLA